ncbi:MAG TPA: hypothetical protein VFB76_19245 [Candidatus Angelobacter sp.]|nr:hypothetical protein [Candidatus Angelobacter sp.]
MNRIVILLAAGMLLAGSVAAQESTLQEKTGVITIDGPMRMPGMNLFVQADPNQQVEKAFFMTEMTAGGELVTNAPYSATAVEETTQTLSDGNRIVRKSSDFVARDSQGRTRRETTLNRVGPVQVDSPKMVFINDPTNHTQYILNPSGDATKVVRSETNWNDGPMIVEMQKHKAEMKRNMQDKMFIATQGMKMQVEDDSSRQVKKEDLGTQTVEGVSAQGKRETVTIPAGQIGNERPIEIVSETWYSPDLHTVVMRKHSDPRVGETVFHLTNISRNEPDASLFQPPANAKIKVEQMHMMEMKQPKE